MTYIHESKDHTLFNYPRSFESQGLDYIAETDKTASNVFTPQNVGVIEFTACLASVIHAAAEMDKFKKALFRQRSREEAGLPELIPVDIDLVKALGHGEPDRGSQLATQYEGLFHGIVGAITEVGEMAEILLRILDREEVPDQTNVREEIGDVLWYLSRLVKYADTTFLTEMERNIKKLRKRHGEAGFNKEGDITRDLEAEHHVLEGLADNPADVKEAEPAPGQYSQDVAAGMQVVEHVHDPHCPECGADVDENCDGDVHNCPRSETGQFAL